MCHAARQSFGDSGGGGRGGGDASQSDGKTCFVKGFDTSMDEDSVRSGLQGAFGEFGEVAEVRLPFDRDNQCLKGFGYVVFAEASGGPVRTPALYMYLHKTNILRCSSLIYSQCEQTVVCEDCATELVPAVH